MNPNDDVRPILWQQARYGMSEDELRAAVPGLRREADPEPLRSGAKVLHVLEGVEVLDRRFTAKFYFLHHALHQVTLSMSPVPTGNEGESAFRSFRTALGIKYGNEVNASSVRDERGTLLASTWLSGPTNVELVFISIEREPEYFNVVYQARLGIEAAKL
jgi:hypothetical protein